MRKETIILNIEHREVLNVFLLYASTELGKIKMEEIIEKVNSSNKVARFLIEAEKINLRIGVDDYLSCIHASTSFFFSKAEHIAIAAVALLMKWESRIGTLYGLSDDIYLNKIFFLILEKCNKYKTHINSKPNFFEKFNDHIFNEVNKISNQNSLKVFKNEVLFDDMMCKAIKNGLKTQFIVDDNLDIINFEPDKWELIGFESTEAAILRNNLLNENIKIYFPYKLGETINVFNSSNTLIVDCKVRITSGYTMRLKELSETDAEKEGYGIYVDKIQELLSQDPSIDAKLGLLHDDCRRKFGYDCLVKNKWAFIFEFDYYDPLADLLKQEKALREVNWDDMIPI